MEETKSIKLEGKPNNLIDRIIKDGRLSLKQEDLKINHHETDLNIKINNMKRCIPLPNILRKSHITDTKIENNILFIYFQVEKKKEDTF